MLQYTWQRANLERNYNENAQNINYASILINPEIPGLAEPQSRDFGIGKKAGIPGFRDPGIPALIARVDIPIVIAYELSIDSTFSLWCSPILAKIHFP